MYGSYFLASRVNVHNKSFTHILKFIDVPTIVMLFLCPTFTMNLMKSIAINPNDTRVNNLKLLLQIHPNLNVYQEQLMRQGTLIPYKHYKFQTFIEQRVSTYTFNNLEIAFHYILCFLARVNIVYIVLKDKRSNFGVGN